MKIIYLNVTYSTGSTGFVTGQLFEQARKNGFDAYYLYGRGEKTNQEKNHVFKSGFEFESKINHFFTLFTNNFYGGSPLGTRKTIHLIKTIKPDIIHINCINGYFINIYRLFSFLKKTNIQVVITNHADFLFTGNCGVANGCSGWKTGCKKCPHFQENVANGGLHLTSFYFKKMERALRGFTNLQIVCVSPWLAERAKSSIIQGHYPVSTIPNPINYCLSKSANPYPKNRKIVLFVCPNLDNPTKGGHFLYDLEKFHQKDDVFFYVIGPSATSDITNKKTKKIIFLGTIPNNAMNSFYSFANVTILLSKSETFSMVAAESLANGTPVIGFMAGGPESVFPKKYTKFVPYGQVEELNKTLESFLEVKNSELSEEMKRETAANFSIDKVFAMYKNIYDRSCP